MKMVSAMNPMRVSENRPAAKTAAVRREEPSTGLAPALEPIAAHEISGARWQEFCNWCSAKLRGIVTDIERDTGEELRTVECRQQPLEQIAAREMANGVTAIDVKVLVNGKPRIFEIAGPSWLRLHCNSAGFPTLLEIGYEEGKLVLHLTGATVAAPVFSGNSWGE